MKPWRHWRGFRWLLFLAPAAAALAYWQLRELPSPYTTNELVVLTRLSPTTYFLNADGNPSGFEYDLAAEFARRNGWTLKVELADDIDALLRDAERARAHIAAAGLTVTPDRSRRLRFGPTYIRERELLICGPASSAPVTLANLAGRRIEVVAGSSHAERLRELRQLRPELHWVEVDSHSTEELLERASTGLTDCTVADSATFDVVWNYLPNLAAAYELSGRRDIAWAMPRQADMRLRQAVQDFFRDIHGSGYLELLRERYFGHLRRLAGADVLGIMEKRARLLPALKPHFRRAQAETGLDWRLLAALAYQESQWDAAAVSPTGVRGIMMLTADTADRLGVGNRLDPEESILGGSRYLALLKDELPPRISEPDRTWMALAAYNIGMGHLEDARRLAGKLGKDPDAWRDLKEVLPLLAKSGYASRLRYGYARGGEARMLAENVRIYFDILAKYEPSVILSD